MLVTDREDIYQRCLFLRDHGRDPQGKMFWNTEVAYKYKMSSMQAALGLAQLERIEDLINRKREIFAWYKESLDGFYGITLNQEADRVKNTYWMVTVILDEKLAVKKEDMIERLKEQSIDARPFFYPLSTLPAYQGVLPKPQPQNTVALSLSPFAVNLPSALNLTQEQVIYVTEGLKRCVKT